MLIHIYWFTQLSANYATWQPSYTMHYDAASVWVTHSHYVYNHIYNGVSKYTFYKHNHGALW